MNKSDSQIILRDFGKKTIKVKADSPEKAKKLFDKVFNNKFN